MDFNQMPLELGYAMAADRLAMNQFSNMSDDEKKEYIERNRSILSDKEVDRISASLDRKSVV